MHLLSGHSAVRPSTRLQLQAFKQETWKRRSAAANPNCSGFEFAPLCQPIPLVAKDPADRTNSVFSRRADSLSECLTRSPNR